MTTQQPIRILQIVYSLNRGGGVINVVLNWHRNIDRNKVQFDYLYVLKNTDTFEQEIKDLGGQIFYLNYRGIRHCFSFLKNAYKFFKEHKYKTIHSHITNLNLFFYPLAKIFGVKNIIQHAHGTKWSDKKLNGWRNYLMLHAVWPLITKKLACSDLAGKFWYGKNYTVVNNGIDINKFTYRPEIRIAKRKELNLENNFVIGHIGRFSNEKNHKFLIDIFENLAKIELSALLVLVGVGPLEQEIKNYVKEKKLQNKVLFLGVRNDVEALYQIFDALCLPSLHEGLPVTGVEAQATGLPCLFSNTITKEVLLLPESKMLGLDVSASVWAKTLLDMKNENRLNGQIALKKAGFDIKDTTQQMQRIYEGCI